MTGTGFLSSRLTERLIPNLVIEMQGFKSIEQAPAKALPDKEQIRKQARKQVEAGPVTENYAGDRETIIKLLNDALATELVCVLRYRLHYHTAKGIHSEPVAQEFLEHANEELAHADMIAARIVQLGGTPDLNPATLTVRSHADYVASDNLFDMIKENLIAERIAVDSYKQIIKYINDSDPTTRRLLENILAKEEEHADELSNLL